MLQTISGAGKLRLTALRQRGSNAELSWCSGYPPFGLTIFKSPLCNYDVLTYVSI